MTAAVSGLGQAAALAAVQTSC
uniref:Uncharacterized protein n=1 Tax=Macrostomum lignano TaxID=282301 RepID=A0A1I8GWM1_9PLAT